MATKKAPAANPVATKLAAACNAALKAQEGVAAATLALGQAKESVVASLRKALEGVPAQSYEFVRASIAGQFPEKEGSKVHLVQLAKYAKVICAITNGYTPVLVSDEKNFTVFVNGLQAHGVKAGWWEAGKGGGAKKPKAAAASPVAVLEASAAVRVVTAGLPPELADAVAAACETGADRTWLAQAWAAEKARRAAAQSASVADKIKGMSADDLAALKKLLAA